MFLLTEIFSFEDYCGNDFRNIYIYIYIKKPFEDVREKQHQYHIV